MIPTDRIERQILIRAPRARVWRAIADAREFGAWFGFELDGEFAPGRAITGRFTGTIDEAALAAHQRAVGLAPSAVKVPTGPLVFCTVERIEPERYFSFRWIPYGIDAEIDPANEPTTLVELMLDEVAGGTMVTVVESGFDGVPAHRRARAFVMNQGGWAAQGENLRAHVEGA